MVIPMRCSPPTIGSCSTRFPASNRYRVTHICARAENEVVIVDLWETEEDLRRMMENPEFLRNLEAAGWPSEPMEQTYQVHVTIP